MPQGSCLGPLLFNNNVWNTLSPCVPVECCRHLLLKVSRPGKNVFELTVLDFAMATDTRKLPKIQREIDALKIKVRRTVYSAMNRALT